MVKIDPIQTKKVFSRTVRVPYKTGETAVLNVKENLRGDIFEISGKVMKKGKEVGDINYHNKKGFSIERYAQIAEEIQSKAKEGFDFITELMPHVK